MKLSTATHMEPVEKKETECGWCKKPALFGTTGTHKLFHYGQACKSHLESMIRNLPKGQSILIKRL